MPCQNMYPDNYKEPSKQERLTENLIDEISDLKNTINKLSDSSNSGNSENKGFAKSELELVKVISLIQYLVSDKPLPENYPYCYDENIHGSTDKDNLDDWTRILCSKCKEIPDMTIHIVELQLWWAKHRINDINNQ